MWRYIWRRGSGLSFPAWAVERGRAEGGEEEGDGGREWCNFGWEGAVHTGGRCGHLRAGLGSLGHGEDGEIFAGLEASN